VNAVPTMPEAVAGLVMTGTPPPDPLMVMVRLSGALVPAVSVAVRLTG